MQLDRPQALDLGCHGGDFRWKDAGVQWFAASRLDNHLEWLEFGPYAGVALRTTDEIYSRALFDYEDVPKAFKIAGKVPVPAGVYQWVNINPYFRTNQGLPLFFRGDIVCCQFYNGHYLKTDIQADWRPNPYFQFQPCYIYTFLSLPTGQIRIHQISANFIINLSPDMQIFNFRRRLSAIHRNFPKPLIFCRKAPECWGENIRSIPEQTGNFLARLHQNCTRWHGTDLPVTRRKRLI